MLAMAKIEMQRKLKPYIFKKHSKAGGAYTLEHSFWDRRTDFKRELEESLWSMVMSILSYYWQVNSNDIKIDIVLVLIRAGVFNLF